MIAHELWIRVSLFLGVLALMAALEYWIPRRKRTIARKNRWGSNLAIVALNAFAVRLLFPLLAIDMALLAKSHSWGLLNNYSIAYPLAVLFGVMVLDFFIYLQHVMFHAVPLFWRLHRMHHSDLDFDVTTGTRFHPIEILLSMGIKIGVVALLGLPALSVLIFEVLLNASSMFTHSNLKLPLKLDALVRLLFVTPDMHRVHHSVEVPETNSNFGFNLSIWDRFFGTYKAQPKAGHQNMIIGLKTFREKKFLRLSWMLSIPFLSRPKKYPINAVDEEPSSK